MEDMNILISVAQRTLVAGTPLLLGTTGEILCERSGILNLGVEGVMAVGAVSAFIVTHHTGNPWLGLCVAMAAGMLVSIIHAFASVSLQSNQVVSGLALTMLGLGIAGLLGKPYVGKPLAIKINNLAIPGLCDIPLVGPVFFNQSPFLYLAIVLAIGAWFLLEHTLLGIRIRSAGENPKATETQGVNVSRVRYLCVIAGGAFSGLAGAHLSISYSKSWIEGMTAGRGWIVIALTIFALWNPTRAILGAFLFGGIFVLQYLLQPLGISPNFLAMLPYLATLLVLLVGGIRDSRRLNAPAMLGEPYRRGER
ncbi:ABC transporter permease [Desulfosarcina ovata subsp. sediminis]|uniref:ABC transporter permease n=1 Tax=Desulfosarcina ovata subsp. sediminis TaxID=885957 RepID=A0A5K7ZTA8_9BACT|nr:ABC transporter permease [Desulfosarcina ovata]BBO83438.1 ABC transporter permease [Desulfosarcina ovata subsp. sediminis]